LGRLPAGKAGSLAGRAFRYIFFAISLRYILKKDAAAIPNANTAVIPE